mgnify:CR=1 FL=1
MPQIKERLKKEYDGYHFSDVLTDIYNPFSVLNVFDSNRINDYWFKTGTPTYLIRLLNHTQENLNELTGKYYDPSEFIDYKADVEMPLPMIYQSGYLTIKDYNMDMNTYLLDFPNNEVKKGFVTMVANDYLKSKNLAGGWARDLVDALKSADLEGNFAPKTTVSAKSNISSSSVAQKSTPNASSKSAIAYHTVKSGDTLWSISQRYGTTVQAIQSLNGMTNAKLSPGMNLRVQ